MNIKNIAMFAVGVMLVTAIIYRVQAVRSLVIGA